MGQQKLAAGTEAPEGIYMCNTCALKIDLTKKEMLPQCSACGSISWRTTRLSSKKASTKQKRTTAKKGSKHREHIQTAPVARFRICDSVTFNGGV